MIALLLLLECVNGQPVVALHPEAHQIDVSDCGSDETLVAHRVEFIIDRPRDAMTVDVQVDRRWSFHAAAKDLVQIQTIRAPQAAREVTLHAAHYRDAAAPLGSARTTLVLHRLPVVRGRVVSAAGHPVAGASIDPLRCTTGGDGTFACEIEEDWPGALRIVSADAATHIVTLDRSAHDSDLGEIRLARGATLAVRIDAPADVRSADVILFRDDVELLERHVRLPLTEAVAFANVEPGTVRLLIKGARPLEQRAENVEIKPGDDEQNVSIRPSELTMRVLSGTRPEPNASITLTSVEGQWRGTMTTDESGNAVEPLWQLGTFAAAVQSKTAASPVMDHREFTAGEKQQWTFQLPIGRIEGVVRNESGAAVPDAEVGLTSDDGDMTTALHTKSDADGRYAFDGVRAGAQTVTATADGYLPSDAVQFRLVENEDARRADLTLHSGKRFALDVVDRLGVPLANATVIATVDNLVSTRSATDANGHAAIQLPAEAPAVLFVIPAGGSFAVHRVTSIDRDSSSIRVMVPDPAASLELKTETTEHKPVPDIHFLVRFDGELMPVEVRGIPMFATGTDGAGKIGGLPLGTYELWPAVGGIDLQMRDVPPPLRIALSPGENAATLTFRAPRR